MGEKARHTPDKMPQVRETLLAGIQMNVITAPK